MKVLVNYTSKQTPLEPSRQIAFYSFGRAFHMADNQRCG